MATMPQAMGISAQGACVLTSFDSEFGNLWQFKFVSSRTCILGNLAEEGRLQFLSPTLSLVPVEAGAALWEILPYHPFRNGPGDVSLQLRQTTTGMLLCSNEKTKKVMLLSPDQAEANESVNIAWEATPDTDEAVGGDVGEIPVWLQEMLLA